MHSMNGLSASSRSLLPPRASFQREAPHGLAIGQSSPNSMPCDTYSVPTSYPDPLWPRASQD